MTGHPEHIYLIGAAVLVTLAAWVYSVQTGPLAHLPGPWYSKWTSLYSKYKWLKGELPQYIHQLHQEYGPVVRYSPTEVDFCDMEAKQQIYTIKQVFRKAPFYQSFLGPGRDNLFTTRDPDVHRRLRRLLQGPLSETSLRHMEDIVRERVELTMRRIGEEMKRRGAADVFKWSIFMATDVIGELSFGESFRMLEKGEKDQYITDLEVVAQLGAVRAVAPGVFYFMQRHNIPTPLKLVNHAKAAGRNFVMYSQQSMERYRRNVERDPANVKPTLFTKLFMGEDAGTLTFNEIRDSAQSNIVAGSDTTAYSLTFLLWTVCGNPAIRDRLVREVQSLPADFTERDTAGLTFLGQVIEETLRLHAAVPGPLPRSVPPEGATISGYFIKGGSVVSTQAYSLHRDPNVFPNPDVFDPDRWATPSKAMKDHFFTFGGGSRVCVGLHLARIELRLATILFFRTFPNSRISSAEGMTMDDMTPEIYFISSMKGKRCLVEAC
ncbi:cytochrome P450 [Thozetella sp. PMI_491]|nr:cytochrome P450 [Thozetella sp. PMI_491]